MSRDCRLHHLFQYGRRRSTPILLFRGQPLCAHSAVYRSGLSRYHDHMNILFVANPALSHILPMVPLAWACRAAGHEVMVATCGFVEHVKSAGLPVVDVAPEFDSPTFDEQ